MPSHLCTNWSWVQFTLTGLFFLFQYHTIFILYFPIPSTILLIKICPYHSDHVQLCSSLTILTRLRRIQSFKNNEGSSGQEAVKSLPYCWQYYKLDSLLPVVNLKVFSSSDSAVLLLAFRAFLSWIITQKILFHRHTSSYFHKNTVCWKVLDKN